MRVSKLWKCAVIVVAGAILAVTTEAKEKASPSGPRPTILVTAQTEIDHSVSASGGATQVGGVVLGAMGANGSVYKHSEVWEVVRRFDAECEAAIFVTNPQTPHSMTVHVDYEKVNGGLLLGNKDIYQLILLDNQNNPLFVSKKNWLRREVKPVCRAIRRQQ